MILLHLTRRHSTTPEQTLGTMEIYKNGHFKGLLCTLEKGWTNNQKQTSCIPPGFYLVSPFSGIHFKNVFEIVDVPGRQGILIHQGNYNTQTRGCILIGLTYTDINADGLLDVGYSTVSMRLLNTILQNETDIQILIK